MITIREGNILDSTAMLIAQCVNCQGAMNSGVAKAIREKYPEVYTDYRNLFLEYEAKRNELLGKLQIVKTNDGRLVANLFTQYRYGYDGARYTSYDAFDNSVNALKVYCLDNNIKTVAIPYKAASDRGGADWNVILKMIEVTFENTDINVEINKL